MRRGRHVDDVAVTAVAAPPPWPPRVDREGAPSEAPLTFVTPAVPLGSKPATDVFVLPKPPRQSPVPAPAPVSEPAPPQPARDETESTALRLLAEITRLCDRIVDHLEAERAERRVMLETLNELARSLAPAIPAVGERVVGGSVDAGPEPDIVLDEFDDYKPNVSVKVKCTTGDSETWVAGFEIADVVPGPVHPSFQIRRKRDGVVLPTMFAAADIRRVRAAWARSG